MSKILRGYERIPSGSGRGIIRLTYLASRPIKRPLPTMTGTVWSEDIENYDVTETVNYNSVAEGDLLENAYRQKIGK